MIHMGKTKVLTNTPDEERNEPSHMEVQGERVDIMGVDASTKYLGRALSFGLLHETEIQHRVNCGWAKFNQYRRELCCRHYPLFECLRLFDAAVTPTVLYGCGSWAVNKGDEITLRTAQRKMLRKIVQVGRRHE
jgi:hypothetical protein